MYILKDIFPFVNRFFANKYYERINFSFDVSLTRKKERDFGEFFYFGKRKNPHLSMDKR